MRNNICLGALICIIFITGRAFAASVSGQIKEGTAFFTKEDYEKAAEKYEQALEKDRESDIINFDLGTTYYKQKKYEPAIRHLQKSLLTDADDLKQKVYYNLGNALYQSGLTQENADINAAVQSVEQAVAQYEQALGIDKDDADTLYNYEYVKKELERLKQKQQQQKEQDKQNQDKQNQDKQNQDKQNDQSQDSRENKQDSSDNKEDQQKQDEQQSQDERQQESEQSQDEKQQESEQPQKSQENKDSAQQEKDKQQSSSDESHSESKNRKDKQSAGSQDPGAMTEKEAEMLLDDYQQNKEPKGLLNFVPHSVSEEPVLKDW